MQVQYSALPYRYTETGTLEILLVTSRSRRRWILPKGLPIEGLTPSQTTARAAYEEAGVRGTVHDKPVGRFVYDRRIDEDGQSMSCEVTVFPLEVDRQHQIWPEVWQRETRWLTFGEATVLIDDAGLKPLLRSFAEKMTAKRKPARAQVA